MRLLAAAMFSQEKRAQNTSIKYLDLGVIRLVFVSIFRLSRLFVCVFESAAQIS